MPDANDNTDAWKWWVDVRDALFTAFIIALFIIALFRLLSPRVAQAATWRDVQYHYREEVTVDCAVAHLCEIEFQNGEKSVRADNALAAFWQASFSPANSGAPSLILRPSQAGLKTDTIIFTDRRKYYIVLRSTTGADGMRVRYRYEDEARHNDRMRPHPRVNASPSPAPITTLDAACALAQPKWRYDAEPKDAQPRAVCQTSDHTFIALPSTAYDMTDLPVPMVVTADGDRVTNYRYDSAARVFTIDGAAKDYALVATAGKKSIHMHLQRADGTK